MKRSKGYVCAVVLLAAVMSSSAHADEGKPLDIIDFGLAGVFASHTIDTLPGAPTSTAYGVDARMCGSLIALFGKFKTPSPGFRFQDWWGVNLGFGYVDKGDLNTWVDFRLELALRAIFMVNSNLEIFSRAGYFTGTNMTPGYFSGLDAIFVTGGVHAGGLLVEAGVGKNGTVNQAYGYWLGSLEYRVRPKALLLQYVGVRVERFDGVGRDDLTVWLTVGSH